MVYISNNVLLYLCERRMLMNQELFGIAPPKKLFAKLAIPSLISMLFSSI